MYFPLAVGWPGPPARGVRSFRRVAFGDAVLPPCLAGWGWGKRLAAFPALRPHLPCGGRGCPSVLTSRGRLSGAQGHETAIPLQRPLSGASPGERQACRLFSRLRHVWPPDVPANLHSRPIRERASSKAHLRCTWQPMGGPEGSCRGSWDCGRRSGPRARPAAGGQSGSSSCSRKWAHDACGWWMVDGGWWLASHLRRLGLSHRPAARTGNVSENLAAWNFPAPGLGRLSEAAWTAGSPFPTGRTTSLPTPNPSRRSISSARHSGSKTVCSSFCGPLDMLQTVKFLPEERSTGAGCCPPKKVCVSQTAGATK